MLYLRMYAGLWHATKFALWIRYVDLIGYVRNVKWDIVTPAGLLGVIIEVSLSVHVCVVTDDLDGVLVSTYRYRLRQDPRTYSL